MKHNTFFIKFLNSFIANKVNRWQKLKLIFADACLKPIILLIIAQETLSILQFLLESLTENSGFLTLQNFSYDNLLKILNPVCLFSAAHDVLLLLLLQLLLLL